MSLGLWGIITVGGEQSLLINWADQYGPCNKHWGNQLAFGDMYRLLHRKGTGGWLVDRFAGL